MTAMPDLMGDTGPGWLENWLLGDSFPGVK